MLLLRERQRRSQNLREDLGRPPFPLQLLRAFRSSGLGREESLAGVCARKLSEEIDGANCYET